MPRYVMVMPMKYQTSWGVAAVSKYSCAQLPHQSKTLRISWWEICIEVANRCLKGGVITLRKRTSLLLKI